MTGKDLIVILNLFSSRPQHPLGDAKEVKRVIAELPLDNAFKAADEIYGWFESLRHVEGFRTDHLFDVVRQLDDAAQFHIRRLTRDYLNSPRLSRSEERRLWSMGFNYWGEVSSLYAVCVDRYRRNPKEKGNDALRAQLPLALDATSLGDRFVVLAVSVVYRGTGLPVAWTVLPAGQQGAWRKEWLRLLRLLHPAVPADWTVIVLADRGLYAGWLYRRIVRLHWHPFLRINNGAKFRPAGRARWYWLKELVRTPGQRWEGPGSCFKDKNCRLECTLLAWWAPANKDPWFIITDLAPADSAVTWYGLRAWCEQGFKCTKRGGWQWHLTQMHHPERAARLWLAMAVAALWTVSMGTELEDGATLDDPALHALQQLLQPKPKRRLRLQRLGHLFLLVTAFTNQPLRLPQILQPEPWPAPLSPAQAVFADLAEVPI